MSKQFQFQSQCSAAAGSSANLAADVQQRKMIQAFTYDVKGLAAKKSEAPVVTKHTNGFLAQKQMAMGQVRQPANESAVAARHTPDILTNGSIQSKSAQVNFLPKVNPPFSMVQGNTMDPQVKAPMNGNFAPIIDNSSFLSKFEPLNAQMAFNDFKNQGGFHGIQERLSTSYSNMLGSMKAKAANKSQSSASSKLEAFTLKGQLPLKSELETIANYFDDVFHQVNADKKSFLQKALIGALAIGGVLLIGGEQSAALAQNSQLFPQDLTDAWYSTSLLPSTQVAPSQYSLDTIRNLTFLALTPAYLQLLSNIQGGSGGPRLRPALASGSMVELTKNTAIEKKSKPKNAELKLSNVFYYGPSRYYDDYDYDGYRGGYRGGYRRGGYGNYYRDDCRPRRYRSWNSWRDDDDYYDEPYFYNDRYNNRWGNRGWGNNRYGWYNRYNNRYGRGWYNDRYDNYGPYRNGYRQGGYLIGPYRNGYGYGYDCYDDYCD